MKADGAQHYPSISRVKHADNNYCHKTLMLIKLGFHRALYILAQQGKTFTIPNW